MADDVDLENLMSTLSRYCFLEVDTITESYSMHSCVHDWTLGELNRELDPRLYWYAFDCVAANLDKDDWTTLGQVKYGRISQHGMRLTNHRFKVCDMSKEGLSARLDKVQWIAQMLQDQVQLSAAEQMFVRALARKEKALGPDHTSTLNTVNNLGVLYWNQGKLEEAE